MLHIGMDDTDSVEGGCTTWLATEVIKELSDFDLIGCPRLVRLNPNVPWKTRGNGAVSFTFGKGKGNKKKIGEIEGSNIFSFEHGVSIDYNGREILERIKAVVLKHSHPDSEPGIVVSDVFLPEGLYWQGVADIVTEDILSDALQGTISLGFRGSRGVCGAACSLAWSGNSHNINKISHTWELIGYREESNWGGNRDISTDSVNKVSDLKGVFSCIDSDGKIAMVPNSPCPVLWGFRGTEDSILIDNFHNLGPEKPVRWLLYRTNQATDDHLRSKEILNVKEGDCIRVEVAVSSVPETIEGGHRFFSVKDSFGEMIKCAAFEPSKDFRHIIDKLEVGDKLIVCGSVNNDTLNLEKIKILDLVTRYSKPPNPICECGKRTHSSGKNSYYRCKACGKKYSRPELIAFESELELGWYEPPASSRRHLSTPASMMLKL